jgi:hypothetical protein
MQRLVPGHEIRRYGAFTGNRKAWRGTLVGRLRGDCFPAEPSRVSNAGCEIPFTSAGAWLVRWAVLNNNSNIALLLNAKGNDLPR